MSDVLELDMSIDDDIQPENNVCSDADSDTIGIDLALLMFKCEPVEKEWSDNDVASFYSHSFSTLPFDKSVRLAEMWWNFYTGRKPLRPVGKCLAVVAYMALHLVDPTKRQAYVVDIAPPGVDLEPYPDTHQLLKKLEASDESVKEIKKDQSENIQQVTHGFLPFESTPETEKEVAAANKWFSTLSPRNQVAFSALIAAICLRTCTKEISVVSNYIVQSALTDFIKLYRRQPVTGIVIPAPSQQFIESVSAFFGKGSTLLKIVLSRFLTAYKISKNSLNTKPIAGLLERSILNKTSGNGLKLVFLAMEAAKVLKVETKEMVAVLAHEQCQEIQKFIDMTSVNVLWPWCRVLHPGYYMELRMSHNTISKLVFAAILWPNGDEPGWNIKALEDVKPVLSSAAELVNHIRSDLAKKNKV